MRRAVICQGDKTSHGGQVLEGNERFTFHGRPIAQLGHQTHCPQCGGNFPIVEGLSFHTAFGRGTAVEGMRTGCGAELIASVTRGVMMIDDRGEVAPSPAEHATPVAQAATTAAGEAHGRPAGDYRAQFRAVDEQTGEPLRGLAYRIDFPDGTSRHGHTDEHGFTEEVLGQEPAHVHLHWLGQEAI